MIKNLGVDVQKIRYRLPATTFFSMGFPEPFKLSAGMSHAIEISFRPIRKEAYDDFIEVLTSKGSMFIQIKATIPSTELAVPSNLDFGFWPVNERTTQTFYVRNLGELPASFRWESHEPFTIEPTDGTLPPYGQQALKITFAPTEAVATVARFTCVQYDQYGGLTRMRYPMRVGGIGKLPFVSVLAERLEFGQVLTGQTASQMFRLRNAAQVHATYQIARDESDRDAVFAFSPAEGAVPADGLKILTVTYKPRASGTRTEEHYTLSTPGGNQLRLTVAGEAVGPRVSLDTTSLDFGDLELRLPRPTHRRLLTISNMAETAVRYQVLADPHGAFALEKGGTGTMGPQTSASVTISFSPDAPANYYRRIYVLFEHQQPLFVDCLGSAFAARDSADKRRPAPLKQHHVDNYHRRERFGWQRAPMEELDARRAELADLLEAHADTGDEASEEAVFRGLFAVDARAHAPVYLDCEHADFGAETGGSRRVRIRNTTDSKVHCEWAVPKAYHLGGRPTADGGLELQPCAFDVSPRELDIAAKGSGYVTVTFNPAAAGSYHAQELECFCAFKAMRSFRLVSEANFTPPWALVLSATGHSFGEGETGFVPRAAFSARSVTFPATLVGEAAHQTLALRNTGDTPLSFAFAPDATGAFAVRPERGVLEKHAFCLVAIRFAPTAAASVRRTLRCVLNGGAATTLTLPVHGQGERAAIELADGGELFLRRTAVGVSSRASHALVNRSRLALVYEVRIPERYARVLSVDQPTGELGGNGRLELQWTFAPHKAGAYTMAVPIVVSAAAREGAGANRAVVERAVLTIRAQGASGALKAEPAVLDFETILVGDASERRFILKNSSQVDLHYELEFEVIREVAGDERAAKPHAATATGVLANGRHTALPNTAASAPYIEAARALLCEQPTGVLPARTVRPIKLQMQPLRRGDLAYECYVVFSTDEPPRAAAGASASQLESWSGGGAFGGGDRTSARQVQRRERLCRIRGRGDYPILKLADVRLAGVEQMALARLWRLQELNRELRSELSDVEVQLNSEAGLVTGGDVGSLAAMLQNFEVLFEPKPVGSEPSVAHVLLSNDGGLPVEWSIRYPTEMELEIEHWADKGEPTAVELKQHMIVDKRIFTVYPRAGKLAVGESVRVEVVMEHKRIDRRYELPLLLAVNLGKRIVLRLVGRTLAASDRLLFLPHATHPLEAVPLGLAHAPVQHVPLTNHCATPLAYRVRRDELDALNATNYGFPVFHVENPVGAVLPGQTLNLRVRFHPLEARVYTLELPIELSGGYGRDDGFGVGADAPGGAEAATLVLSARGYHPASEARTTGESSSFVRDVLPPHQLVTSPGQRALLSHDFVDVGVVPLQAVVTRAVFVRNLGDKPVQFAWRHKHADFALLASVEPVDGFVEPGGSALCRVRVCAETRPEVLDFSLVCAIELAPDLSASAVHGGGEVEMRQTVSRETIGSRRSAAASLLASVRTRGGARTTVVAWRPRVAQVGGPRAPLHSRRPKEEYGEGGELGAGGAPGLGRTASRGSVLSAASRPGTSGTSGAETVLSGFKEGGFADAAELFLNVRGVVLEMGHFLAHHKQRLVRARAHAHRAPPPVERANAAVRCAALRSHTRAEPPHLPRPLRPSVRSPSCTCPSARPGRSTRRSRPRRAPPRRRSRWLCAN